uniref:Uncharacterized protein n=1 Tax=Arundo donax TaxID=35708 RepID=A0A0A9BTS5_ARUDO
MFTRKGHSAVHSYSTLLSALCYRVQLMSFWNLRFEPLLLSRCFLKALCW